MVQANIDAVSWKPLKSKLTVNDGEVLMATLELLCEPLSKPKSVLNKRYEASFRLNPVLSCKNISSDRLHKAVWGLQILDRTYMFRPLAHLCNLLMEEGYLETEWHDVHYLCKMLGERFVYQGERPNITSPAGKKMLRNRLLFSWGYKEKDIPKFKKFFQMRDRASCAAIPKAVIHNFFVSANWPLSCFLTVRDGIGLHAHDMVEDAAAIVNATYIQPLVDKPAVKVRFEGEGTDNTFLHNKAELQKLYAKGPRLSPVDLLIAQKQAIKHEMRITEFNYLKFTQAFLELIDSLVAARHGLLSGDTPVPGGTWRHYGDKINRVVLDLILFEKEEKFKTIARVFKDWLSKYGSVGSEDFPKVKPKTMYPLPMRPDVVKLARDIVARRGLTDDVFIEEQVYGMGVEVTGSFKEHIKDVLEKHLGKPRCI